MDFLLRPKPYPSPIEITQSTHKSIRDTLVDGFPQYPPHTFQRLAELILYPKREYKYLPSYLQALYRVVAVSSTTEALPLIDPAFANAVGPRAMHVIPIASPASLLVNGTSSNSDTSSINSDHDDSLGGALLTPIPWFRGSESPEPDLSHDQTPLFETLADPPEVSMNGGIGEPGLVNGEQSSVTELGSSGTTSGLDGAAEEEVPHARGPDEIGIEDTGMNPGPGGAASLMAERLVSPPAASAPTTADDAKKTEAETPGSDTMDVDLGEDDEKE
jgi:PPP4R2